MTVAHTTAGKMDLKWACLALNKNKAETLDLSGKKLGKKGVQLLAKALANNTSLQVLNLTNTKIGTSELQILQTPLAKHPKVKRLEIAGNSIGRKGFLIVIEILKGNKNLRELNLGGSGIGTASITEFSKIRGKRFRLTTLSLAYNPLGKPSMVPSFCKQVLPNRTLTRLNLRRFNHSRMLSSDATNRLDLGKIIEGCSALQYLNLAQNHIEVNGLSSIAFALFKNTTLLTLNLSGNPLLAYIAMKKDKLATTAKVVGKAFVKLGGGLFGAAVGSSVDSEEWHYNRDGRGIQKLGLALQRNKNIALTTLHLDNLFRNSLSDSEEPDIRRIIQCSSLEELQMVGEKLSPISHYKLQMALEFRKKPLTISIPALPKISYRAIPKLKRDKVKILDLSQSKLVPVNLAHLGAALKKNSFLTELNLSGNDLSLKKYVGLRDVALGLLRHPSLRKLSLRNTKINDSAASVIATFLSYNTSITDLDLSENKIKMQGFKEFLCRLPYPAGPVVPFGMRDIGTEETFLGKEMYQLEEDPSMVDSYVPVCDDQMASLQRLNLSCNPLLISKFQAVGQYLLIRILGRNTTLRALDFSALVRKGSRKTLKDKYLLPFDQLLKKNTSLTSLNLEGYKVGETVWERIEDKLVENRVLGEKSQKKKAVKEKLHNKEAPTSSSDSNEKLGEQSQKNIKTPSKRSLDQKSKERSRRRSKNDHGENQPKKLARQKTKRLSSNESISL